MTRVPPTLVTVVDAAYGNADVFRGPMILNFSTAVADQELTLLVAVPVVLSAAPINFFFTKPDGTLYNVIGSPFAFTEGLFVPTGLGTFTPQAWAAYLFDFNELDQSGVWSVSVQQGTFTSVVGTFTVAPNPNIPVPPIVFLAAFVDLNGNCIVDTSNNAWTATVSVIP